jgi:hypothetical protein
MNNSKAYELSESRIRYAMANTQSNRQAANFLNVAYNTYKKYSKIYIDEESGKSLFELHKNRGLKGGRKGIRTPNGGHVKAMEILEGKFPNYPGNKLKDKLLAQGLLESKCYNELCTFHENPEERIKDGALPLRLDWKDGDTTNHKLDNLQLLCYNCYFLQVGNLNGNMKKFEDL